jgi:hypothetical protein
LGRLVDEVEFRVHYAARSKVAALAESGPLRPRSSTVRAVPLPPGYPRSISDAGGQRMLDVSRDDAATQVVFVPPTGWRNEGSWLVYRSDDRPPSLPDQHFPDARRVEKLRDHWYRLRPAE